MNRPKWFVRAGVLILLLGFFMPTMLVSCSGLTTVEQSFSLAELASQAEQPILYLFLLGVLSAGVFSLLPIRSPRESRNYLLGQGVSVSTGLLVLILSLLSLSSQIQQSSYGMIKVKPDIGAFLILGGLVLFGVGWYEQWSGNMLPMHVPIPRPSAGIPQLPDFESRTFSPGDDEPTQDGQALVMAKLEPVMGMLPRQVITVAHDDFTIGRSSENNLVIPDTAVSRHHARLRYAQGTWFIQDTNSTGGVKVNGELVPATRLEPGDQIEIAGNTFVFRC